MNRQTVNRSTLLIGIVIGLLLTTAILSISLGETYISPIDWMTGRVSDSSAAKQIVYELRIPRVLNACLVGGALACAGAAFQGLFRNLLAEPYIIGASSGAALGVAIAIVLGIQSSFLGLGATTLMAMIGGLAVVTVVLLIGTISGSNSTVTLLLVGIAISSFINAMVSALMIMNNQRAVAVLSWLMGSLAGSHWGSIAMAALIALPAMLTICFFARALDAFSLGDDTAQSLGLSLAKFRFILVAAASLATAAAVASAGIIGFVGLVGPLIARQLIGQRHAVVIPLSIGIGAILMMLADLISRTVIAPAELPVGIVTAIVGSPFFLWLLLKPPRSR